MFHCTLSGQVRPQVAVDAWGSPIWEDLFTFEAESLEAALRRAFDEGWSLIGKNPKPNAYEDKIYYNQYGRTIIPGAKKIRDITQYQLENSASDEGELVCEDLEA